MDDGAGSIAIGRDSRAAGNSTMAMGDGASVENERVSDALAVGETVVAVGNNDEGQCKVTGWSDIVAISVGSYNTMGLKADGTMVIVGDNEKGQCNASGWKEILLPGEHVSATT